jgi:histidine phosphotransferase ChpT
MVVQTDSHNHPPALPFDQTLRLINTLSARLCHDLAGAIGSLGGAIELAALDRDAAAEALGLAQEAVQSLQDRLKLLRAAFGPAEERISRAELHRLIELVPRARRVRIELAFPADGATLPGAVGNLLLCLAILAVESLSGEGLAVLEQSSPNELVLQIAGPRAAWPAGLAAALVNPAVALEHASDQGPRGIVGPLAALMAAASGTKLRPLLGAPGDPAAPLLICFE